jgi:para-nitrobenzyl esterase
MKHALIALAFLMAAPAWAQAPSVPVQVAPAAKYSVQTTKLGELLANPATKALFEKYFPEVANHPQINEGLDLTLPDVVQYLPEVVTPEKLAAMDAELKALPQ